MDLTNTKYELVATEQAEQFAKIVEGYENEQELMIEAALSQIIELMRARDNNELDFTNFMFGLYTVTNLNYLAILSTEEYEQAVYTLKEEDTAQNIQTLVDFLVECRDDDRTLLNFAQDALIDLAGSTSKMLSVEQPLKQYFYEVREQCFTLLSALHTANLIVGNEAVAA